MTEIHALYRAVGHQTENVDGGVMHKIWIHGTLRPFEIVGAEKHFFHDAAETMSKVPETELWFLNYIPAWVMLAPTTA